MYPFICCQKQLQDGTWERPRKTKFSMLTGPRETVTGGIRRPRGAMSPRQWALSSRWGGEREKGRCLSWGSAKAQSKGWRGISVASLNARWSRWGEGKKASGGRASLHAGAPGHLGGVFTPCEDVQTAGRYEVLKFTVETVRFWVSSCNFSVFVVVSLRSIRDIPPPGKLYVLATGPTGMSESFFFFLQTPKFKSYLTRILIEKIDYVIPY